MKDWPICNGFLKIIAKLKVFLSYVILCFNTIFLYFDIKFKGFSFKVHFTFTASMKYNDCNIFDHYIVYTYTSCIWMNSHNIYFNLYTYAINVYTKVHMY